jgi:hypothetical protein
LLERPLPSTLTTVWACEDCNQGSSRDEQYLLTLISHASTSATLSAQIEQGGSVDRALQYDATLDDELLDSLAVDEETGMPYLRPNMLRVERVVTKIARGLFALRFGRIPRLGQVGRVDLYPYDVVDRRSTDLLATYSERFLPKRWVEVQPHVFSYIFVRPAMRGTRLWCVMNLHDSLWGVVDLPHPRAASELGHAQGWLFPEAKRAA